MLQMVSEWNPFVPLFDPLLVAFLLFGLEVIKPVIQYGQGEAQRKCERVQSCYQITGRLPKPQYMECTADRIRLNGQEGEPPVNSYSLGHDKLRGWHEEPVRQQADGMPSSAKKRDNHCCRASERDRTA